MREKRRHPRFGLKATIRCRDESSDGELSFDSGDLSAGGAFLLSDLLFERDEELALTLSLPEAQAPLQVKARVAWVQRFPHGEQAAGMGVEFIGMSDEDQRVLLGLLER